MYLQGNIKTVPRADRTFFHAAYFITRMKLLKLLKSKIETSDFAGCIEMRFDTSVSDIVPAPKGSDGFLVSAEPKDGKPYVITAQLLVGASGVRTPVNQVRSWMGLPWPSQSMPSCIRLAWLLDFMSSCHPFEMHICSSIRQQLCFESTRLQCFGNSTWYSPLESVPCRQRLLSPRARICVEN